MWQKQLHDEGENQSDTANDESASTSSIDDLLTTKKKPAPINTEVIEIDDEENTNPAQQDNIVSSPTQVETIELDEGEENKVEGTPEVNNISNITTASSSTSTDGANKNNGSSPKRNKKKKSKSKSKSRF